MSHVVDGAYSPSISNCYGGHAVRGQLGILPRRSDTGVLQRHHPMDDGEGDPPSLAATKGRFKCRNQIQCNANWELTGNDAMGLQLY